jgi:predicted component of type VI protein secretion system
MTMPKGKSLIVHGERRVSRRGFIVRTAQAFAGAAAWAVVGCGTEVAEDGPPPDDPSLPSLGGAPDTLHGWTIAAFCDTVVPGAWRDPEGAPGAIDVGAVALFFDETLPAATYVPLLATMLDSYAGNLVGHTFIEATPSEREEVLETLLDQVDLVEFAVQLAKLAYYVSEPAEEHLGYPGPNPGYVHDPDFTFGVALSTEITEDGNLP